MVYFVLGDERSIFPKEIGVSLRLTEGFRAPDSIPAMYETVVQEL
jgi:hypothetical protein